MTEYRKRFVQFNMLLIGLVLTVMVCLVAVYMPGLLFRAENHHGAGGGSPERFSGRSEIRKAF